MCAGDIIMPHIHPEDENIVVVKGSWAAAMGDHFNRQALEPMEVGTYVAEKNGALRPVEDRYDPPGPRNRPLCPLVCRSHV